MSKPKILFELRGGRVTNIVSAIPLDLMILDHDNLESAKTFNELADQFRDCYPLTIAGNDAIMERVKNLFISYEVKTKK